VLFKGCNGHAFIDERSNNFTESVVEAN
jgi:hypothetical protein